ncbi:MAG: DUF5931 domain-containing protein [Gordonia sp. (in: high G+C Gram-positive bacteria)]|uniref:MacS family sensor histidine kinase n=1 Tax=Gordonia sp. (in: high G+C Gram-positive bacteria) TaxID=84139 RepID=UPI003BB65989
MTAPKRIAVTTRLDRLFPAAWQRRDDVDPVGPLWRGAQIFRLVAFLYALGFQIAVNSDLARPGVTWALFAVLALLNVPLAAGYLMGFGRRWSFVIAELALFAGAMLSTSFVASSEWIAENQTWPTTLWAASPVLSAALLGGTVAGGGAGVVIGLANFAVKGQIFWNFGRNATFLLLVIAGLAIGLAASRTRLTHAKLTAAVQAAARAGERERLARHVHDGVLQTLALIARRGREIGGPTGDLAELAATQEGKLRRLIAEVDETTPAIGKPLHRRAEPHRKRAEPLPELVEPLPELVEGSTERLDIGPALRALASASVSISTPADSVLLPRTVAEEALAAVTNILDNSARHAGAGAHSYVLLEDLDDVVILSLRDDGVGIEDGRLAQAATEGRMGVSRSIVGRIEALGGRVSLDSTPGAGTEWELTIPVGDAE